MLYKFNGPLLEETLTKDKKVGKLGSTEVRKLGLVLLVLLVVLVELVVPIAIGTVVLVWHYLGLNLFGNG